jgi:hypothetical protein
MNSSRHNLSFALGLAVLFAASLLLAVSSSAADMQHVSSQFMGAKANTGHVTHTFDNGRSVLTLSDDFVSPETPDPHWQLVDSDGNTYLLDRLMAKNNKMNRQIVVPTNVKDVVKVQIWCAYAETNLGEASFQSAIK